MTPEQVVPDFKKDHEYRAQLVVLEDLEKNMAIITKLGGSYTKDDNVMINHIATSYDAAVREDILRAVLNVDEYPNEDTYWRAVAQYDQDHNPVD